MGGTPRFAVFVVVSCVAFLFILQVVLRRRATKPQWSWILATAIVVVPGGMVFARWGATVGLAWWVYYTVPAFVTLVVPLVVFRLSRIESIEYLVLAFLMAPAVHTAFSLFLGWNEYMPFLHIPSLWELLRGAG